MKLLFHKHSEILLELRGSGGVGGRGLRKPLPAKIKHYKCPGTEKKTWEKGINQGGKIDCACANFESVIWVFGIRIE